MAKILLRISATKIGFRKRPMIRRLLPPTMPVKIHRQRMKPSTVESILPKLRWDRSCCCRCCFSSVSCAVATATLAFLKSLTIVITSNRSMSGMAKLSSELMGAESATTIMPMMSIDVVYCWVT